MSEYAIVDNPSADLWKSFLDMVSEGNFDQCFEYGEIARMAFPKTKAARLAVTQDGKPAAIVQGTFSTYLGFGMSLRVMRGPVVHTRNNEGLQLIENILKALEDHAKRSRIINAQILVPEAWNLCKTFNELGYTLIGGLNEYVVNLQKSPDELWKNIAHNKRRNIKKALNEMVEVIETRSHEDLVAFYSMLKAAQERAGFSSYPLSWFEAVWKVYEPKELSKVFLTRLEGKTVSGVFVVIHGKTVYALAAGSLSEGWKVRPNDIMHWKVMEWACQNGYSKYHMGLVSEPPPEESSSAWGIWRWKKEWNGSLEKVQIFDKLIMPRYRLVLKGKELVERLYNRVSG